MDEKTNLSLGQIYQKYQAPDGGGDKGTAHTYIEIYEREMSKTNGISLLEIGIWEGHSIAMWQDYFANSTVVGIDIDLGKIQFPLRFAIKADATKPVKELANLRFDYIIDDGSHNVNDQISSLRLLWDNLKAGGKYFIEDIRGDNELVTIESVLRTEKMSYRVYDNRSIKNRSDDIMVVVDKE